MLSETGGESAGIGDESRGQGLQLFQGVRCGKLAVAFPYGWATQIVEQYELSPVPKAPAWLAGAANIDGRIVPVIDLAHFRARTSMADPATISALNATKRRLLIGGLEGGNGDLRLAILFDGLPEQVSRENSALATSPADRLRDDALTDGFALSKRRERYAVVNVERLCAQLIGELSTL